MARRAFASQERGESSWWSQLGSARGRYAAIIAERSGVDRTLAFSDAVFAIAMTILVLELHVPDVDPSELPAELLHLLPPYLTFALSFVVVGIIWLSHHRKFAVMTRFSQTLLRLNLLMLLLVASLALPTSVLGRYGDQVVAVVLYAAFVSGIGLLMAGIWIYAWRTDLVDPRVDPDVFRFVLTQSLIIPFTFLISIPIALTAGANAGEYSWIIAFVLMLGLRYLTRGPASPPPRPTA